MIVSMILSMIAPTRFYVTTLTTLTVSSCVNHFESNTVSTYYLHQLLLPTPAFYLRCDCTPHVNVKQLFPHSLLGDASSTRAVNTY